MIPPIASRFVAGETAATAMDRVRELNRRDVGAILNLLGEHYDDREEAIADADAYCRLLDDIADAGLRARVSVKPSQVGLGIDESLFRGNVQRLVERADERDGVVWLDMEDHTTTDATLDAFAAVAEEHPGSVGVCVQANLERTRDDLARLAGTPGKIRLVKGAYDPPADLAYRGRERVTESYESLLAYLFRSWEGGVAVATHDPRLIDRAIALGDEHGTAFEIQMLMGVREDAQYELAADHEVWQYVPYGGKWAAYFYRRVAERKENLLFALRAVFGR